MGDTGLSLQLFMAGDDDIIVTQDWKPRPGDPMPQMPGVRIGKQFGAGGWWVSGDSELDECCTDMWAVREVQEGGMLVLRVMGEERALVGASKREG
jgi:hypothetical protein